MEIAQKKDTFLAKFGQKVRISKMFANVILEQFRELYICTSYPATKDARDLICICVEANPSRRKTATLRRIDATNFGHFKVLDQSIFFAQKGRMRRSMGQNYAIPLFVYACKRGGRKYPVSNPVSNFGFLPKIVDKLSACADFAPILFKISACTFISILFPQKERMGRHRRLFKVKKIHCKSFISCNCSHSVKI